MRYEAQQHVRSLTQAGKPLIHLLVNLYDHLRRSLAHVLLDIPIHLLLVQVERFYKWLSKQSYGSEATLKCKKRFEKTRGKLFTFLDYDGIPWNNNNAEHAIKAFARLRDKIRGSATEKGI